MAALTRDRKTDQYGTPDMPAPNLISIPVKAAAVLFAGSIVCTDATGFAVKGATATGLKCWGRASIGITGGVGNGDVSLNVEVGAFMFNNSSAGDLIAQADVGNLCYIVDDNTVAKTNGTNTRSAAGRILGLVGTQVAVLLGAAALP